MSKFLSEWQPSEAALDLVKLNGANEDHIKNSVEYLKNHADLEHIDDVDGYDNWNSFFIMFCIKASKQPEN